MISDFNIETTVIAIFYMCNRVHSGVPTDSTVTATEFEFLLCDHHDRKICDYNFQSCNPSGGGEVCASVLLHLPGTRDRRVKKCLVVFSVLDFNPLCRRKRIYTRPF